MADYPEKYFSSLHRFVKFTDTISTELLNLLTLFQQNC
jgi:hypothetical protein